MELLILIGMQYTHTRTHAHTVSRLAKAAETDWCSFPFSSEIQQLLYIMILRYTLSYTRTQKCPQSCFSIFFLCFEFLPSSHNKLGHLLCTQVQGKVLIGSFDGKRVLVITDTNPLFCHSLVTIAKLLHATKCVTVSRVLTGLHPLWGIPLVQTNIIQWLAVPVCGVLRLPAWHHLNNKYKQQKQNK